MSTGFYLLWEVSHRMVNDLQTELKYVKTEDNIDHFLRETMQRTTLPGGNSPTTDQPTLINKYHTRAQSDYNSTRQFVMTNVEMGMKTTANIGDKNVNMNAEEAYEQNENGREYQMEPESETETENNQDNHIEENILMEFAGRVMEVIDMHKDVKTILGAKMTKTRNRSKQMRIRRMKESIQERNVKKTKEKKKEGTDSFHRSKASSTYGPKSTVKFHAGLKHRATSMQETSSIASSQVHTRRSVQYKTCLDSTPTVDQDIGPADDTSSSTIWTPEESCLSSDELP